MSTHLFVTHPQLLNHGIASHPENASRLEAVVEEFSKSSHAHLLRQDIGRYATREALTLVHDVEYVDRILSLDGIEANIDYETLLTSGSVKAARLATGIGLELVEQVWNGDVKNGFALVRPPGHHSRPSIGMGFCIFNNIAIAAKHLLALGAHRILILDWDVHHGNGTQETFFDDNRVMLIDMHQENLFPVDSGKINEIGQGKGLGYTVNIPLPSGCVDGDYLFVFDQVVQPIATRFKPEMILVSAGFDAHESDPLGFMKLTTEGYGALTQRIKALAEQLCGGKLAFFLEGGYNSYFLAKNVLACVAQLVKEDNTEIKKSLTHHIEVAKRVKELHERHNI